MPLRMGINPFRRKPWEYKETHGNRWPPWTVILRLALRSGGRLIANAREQKIITRIRHLRAEGLSYRGIATRLDGEGIRPKRGRRWIHTTVKGILMRNAS